MVLKVFNCKRCGHSWPSKQDKPGMCPKCKTRLWDKAKKRGHHNENSKSGAVIPD